MRYHKLNDMSHRRLPSKSAVGSSTALNLAAEDSVAIFSRFFFLSFFFFLSDLISLSSLSVASFDTVMTA